MGNDESCVNCKFAFDPDGGGLLECRRYAPQPLVTLAFADDKVEQDRQRWQVPFIHWPPVGNDDWCGEWISEITAIAEEQADQPFPWNEIPGYASRVRRGISAAHNRKQLLDFTWPLSCQDLARLTFDGMLNFKSVGIGTISAIDKRLRRLGYEI